MPYYSNNITEHLVFVQAIMYRITLLTFFHTINKTALLEINKEPVMIDRFYSIPYTSLK